MTRARPAGFTLIELLVALVIFGLLMTGLFAGVRFGLGAWHHETRLAGAGDDLDAVDRVLRRLVAESDPEAEAKGAADRLAWTGFLPEGAPSPIRRADMALLVTADHRLVLRWAPDGHAERLGPPPAPRETVLLDGVAGLDLSYWQDKGTAGWRNGWAGIGLPRLLKIHLVFPPGDPRAWPDIVAAEPIRP
jgi:general secretion pathway protein J